MERLVNNNTPKKDPPIEDNIIKDKEENEQEEEYFRLTIFVSILLSFLKLSLKLYMMLYLISDGSLLCKNSSFNLNIMTFGNLFHVLKIKLSLILDGRLRTNWM